MLVVVTEEMERRTAQLLGGDQILRAANDLEENASISRAPGRRVCEKGSRVEERDEDVQCPTGALGDFAELRHYDQAEKTTRRVKKITPFA